MVNKNLDFLKMKVGTKRYLKIIAIDKILINQVDRIRIQIESEYGNTFSVISTKINPDRIKGLFYRTDIWPPSSGVYSLLKFYQKKSLDELIGEKVLVDEDAIGNLVILAYDPNKAFLIKN